MPKLTVYRQKRLDGGVRTGIELDDVPLCELFTEGVGEREPALLWFVDLRCEGPGVPDDPDSAETWLLDQSSTIREGFSRFADKLHVGADRDEYALKWNEFQNVPEGVEMIIVGSAVRRIDAQHFAEILSEMADHWDENIQSLLATTQAR